MRALHVPHAYPPAIGGSETLARRVGMQLVARGHEVHAVTPAYASAEGWFVSNVPTVSPLQEVDHGVVVERVELDRRRDRILSPASRTRRLQRRFERSLLAVARDERPDVIMTLPHLLPNVAAALKAGRSLGIPVVMVPLLHEDDPNWPTDELRSALADAGAVVALTSHERDRLSDGYGVSAGRIFVSGLGIDPSAVASAPSEPPTVGFIGRLAPSKNLSLLFDAMHAVWTVLPETRLVVAGSQVPGVSDPDEWLTSLDPARAARVEILKDVTDNTKTNLLSRLSCFVSPSLVESFGLVILEAMAAGVPVVCADSPVNREITGRKAVLEPADPGSFAAGILRVLQDSAGARRLAEEGRAWVHRTYSWSQVTDAFEQAYALAVSSRRPAL